MELTLKRPLVFFDLETTGIDVLNDRIVEISIIKVMPASTPGSENTEQCFTWRVNPGIPIPAEATAVHHITDEMVSDAPSFEKIAGDISKIFEGADIAGFNSNRFDIPMLDQEFRRANIHFDFSKCNFVDVQTIYHKREPRNLIAAYRFYCGKVLVGPHSADVDIRATYEVLKAQLDLYDDLPHNIEELSKYSSQNRNVDFMGRLIYDDKGREVINFGKYKGRLAEDVLTKDPGYFGWIMRGDFSENTKDAFKRIHDRTGNK